MSNRPGSAHRARYPAPGRVSKKARSVASDHRLLAAEDALIRMVIQPVVTTIARTVITTDVYSCRVLRHYIALGPRHDDAVERRHPCRRFKRPVHVFALLHGVCLGRGAADAS